MSISLHDFLEKQIKKMVIGIGNDGQGNIYPLIMQETERTIISLVLEETNYNLFITAKMLGISRSTLYRKLENLSIDLNKS